jgi:hypothetical protein
LAILHNLPAEYSGSDSDDDSSGEDECRDDDDLGLLMNAACNSDSSSSSSSSAGSDEETDSGDETDVAMSREGTCWKRIVASGVAPGRVSAQNVLRSKPGLTSYSRAVSSELDAWRLIIDEGMIRHIRSCTEENAQLSHSNWSVSESELDKFIGLTYLRGAMNQRNFPLNLLWSEDLGIPMFRRTMARNRFREIKKFLRFDSKSTRSDRVQTDKFCLASWILSRFVENSQKAYKPEESLTVDEQLFPTKARCRFTQFMPSKPDKYGIKFWILVELKSKFCLNIAPYLGKDENRVDSLGTHVVMKLMQPFFGLGYNVTTDNFFTSHELAQKLCARRTSIVGTVRSSRKDLPPPPKLDLHESQFYESGPTTLAFYQCKASKMVILLSTLHKGAGRSNDEKKKPDIVHYYNKNKCGVDLLDSMCRQTSTKAGCRRWPLAVFYNILDLAAVNAWIIFCKATGRNISRRTFIISLANQLASTSPPSLRQMITTSQTLPEKLSARVNCRVKLNCNHNRTTTLCIKCKRPVCGQCLSNKCLDCDKE